MNLSMYEDKAAALAQHIKETGGSIVRFAGKNRCKVQKINT
jgi:hypothetical protein